MKAKRASGYSAEVAKIYITDETKVLLLSTELQEQVKWVDHKPTDQVTGYKVLCGMPNDYFTVKFETKYSFLRLDHLLNSKDLRRAR